MSANTDGIEERAESGDGRTICSRAAWLWGSWLCTTWGQDDSITMTFVPKEEANTAAEAVARCQASLLGLLGRIA